MDLAVPGQNVLDQAAPIVFDRDIDPVGRGVVLVREVGRDHDRAFPFEPGRDGRSYPGCRPGDDRYLARQLHAVDPPSMTYSAPVEKLASVEHSHTTRLATSRGVILRPIGWLCAQSCSDEISAVSKKLATIGVSTIPGWTELQRIGSPRRAQ
jgi:hypothetical protein